MKKSYTKPLFYYKDYKKGKVITNSFAYAEKLKRKFAEMKESEISSSAEETESCYPDSVS